MRELNSNFWALVGCVVIRMAIGALWYSPVLFLRPWQRMSGVSDRQMAKGMARALLFDVILGFGMAMVLLQALRAGVAPGPRGLTQGMTVAFFAWVGLVLPAQSALVTYEHRPLRYLGIVTGYQLVSMLAMGAVLTLAR